MFIKKILMFATLSVATYAEISVFDAGNLNSTEPYGLSDNEKIIYQSKKKVENLSRDYTGANSRINELSDKVNGLQSVLESTSKSVYDNSNQIKQINQELSTIGEKNIELEKKLDELILNTKTNASNIKKLQKSIQELSLGLQQIATVSNSDISLQNSAKLTFDGKNRVELLQTAIDEYNLKKYNEAKAKFLYLAENKHRPAQCNFYLGQIAFETKDYNNALYHYKQSNALYKKAKVESSFMPTILLNSGLSLKYQGREEEAKVFFNALKDMYPNSKEVKKIQ